MPAWLWIVLALLTAGAAFTAWAAVWVGRRQECASTDDGSEGE